MLEQALALRLQTSSPAQGYGLVGSQDEQSTFAGPDAQAGGLQGHTAK